MFRLLPAVLYAALYLSTLTTTLCTSPHGVTFAAHHNAPSLEHRQSSTTKRVYKLTDRVIGKAFYDWFEWEAFGNADPTNGRVNYLNFTEAKNKRITVGDKTKFILRADNTTVLDPNGPNGRDSARLKSKKTFEKHVAIFEVRHLPAGCGTWPAIWEVDHANWPGKGEIDIVEGINDQSYNQAALHSTQGCTMPSKRTQQGTNGLLDCDVAKNYGAGCVTHFKSGTFGPTFNANGGGYFAFERYEKAMNVYFWPRNSKSIPADVKNATATSVNPAAWGVPYAHFPNTQCDFKKYFGKLNIIINLTFCGAWAGPAYQNMGCPGTCLDRVNKNPGAFSEAYFDIRRIDVFQ